MSNIIKIDYSKLLLFDRLDIIIKYLYIESFENNNNFLLYKKLYKKHILKRTKGLGKVYDYINNKVEIVEYKNSIEDYFLHFEKLINSFKKNGFDNNHFIPISKINNIILDGSHRAACCLYFKINPYVIFENNKGKKWDYNWFYKNNFSDNELNLIINKYLDLKNKNCFAIILWGSVKKYWDEIEKIIADSYKILMSKNFNFNLKSFENIINDLYSYEFNVILPHKIHEKIELLKNFNYSLRLIFIEVDNYNFKMIDTKKICENMYYLKDKIRNTYNNVAKKDKFITIHTSDFPEHSDYIKRIFLSNNNLKNLEKRKESIYREEFLDWLIEFDKTLKKFNIFKNDVCIVGSGPLEVLGIRYSTDIDFILKENIRNKLFDDKSKNLSKNIDIVHKNYHKYKNEISGFSDDEIIDNEKLHFYFRGFKFANLEIIRDRKSLQRRKKDVQDVMLIDNFLS